MPDEARLVSNLLEALDRLYDQQTTVKDLHALLEASAVALGETSLAPELIRASKALDEVLRRPGTESDRNLEALRVTDPLRRLVAAH